MMHTMVRKLALTLAMLLVLGGTAFASGSQESGGSDEPTTLLVWEHTPQFEAPLAATLENFMAQNPDIRVEYEIKTPDQYYALLSTAIQAGEAPDLFWTNGTATTDLPNLVRQGAVMDLTDELDLSDYPQLAVDMTTVDGSVYLTPGATIGTRAVYYNKDMFDEFGLSVPETFGEFEQLLADLSQEDVIPVSLGGRFTWSILFHFEPILAAMAPDWIAEATAGEAPVTDPRVEAALDKMIEWGEAGYYGDGYLGMDEGGQLLAFSRGDAAMTITGSWNAATLQQNNPEMNIGAFQIPTRDGREPMVVTFATGFSVYSGTEHPEEAIRLAQYLTSVESQQIWVDQLGDVPGLPGVTTDDRLVSEIVDNDFQVNSFYTILGQYAADGGTPTRIWEEDNVRVLSGSLSPAAFLESLDAEMEM